MKRPLAFALGGGGARGALQVGALRALLEAGIRPDILVGTSVGAVNATHLAMRGFNPASLDSLIEAWHAAASADLLPSNYLWLTLRILFNRAGWRPGHRMRGFFTTHGLSPQLRFSELRGAKLILVAADLNSGRPVLYGVDPQQSVLEGLLASTALPPWVHPMEKGAQLLIDGGVVSNLPIEPTLAQGAGEIIALDLADPREAPPAEAHGFGPFLGKLMSTIERRQREMEMALAESRGVLVRRIGLLSEQPVATWDFKHTPELIEQGYSIARQEIESWEVERRSGIQAWLDRLVGRREVE